ncbi:pyridoxal-phosphate dependent enzyme, partial [Saccharomonospora halophila]|uniref:pyridoxal-phosphate dependent enzyme n=1 Tax=Saccharomonospora halophila TaxID=129922 RepID=UPI0005842F5B
MDLVTVQDIRAAADRIRGATVRTPVLPCPWAGEPGSLWVKPESLQAVGAFKIRGAVNALARLDAGRRRRGVVTYSSGNHARAVAAAARAA